MTGLQFFEEAAKLAPLGTAAIALGAACIAWSAIKSQKDIARRRAAIDFFSKTETDEKLIMLYDTFKSEIKMVTQGAPISSIVNSQHYKDLRAFLNLCELIAVGIRRKAFSDDVSFHYWADVLRDSFRDAKPLIDYVRKAESTPATYCDLEWLCSVKWKYRE